ncbi:cbb3-type cytochrome oxidase assembly protein CcoS [Geomonas sp. Red69]|uniref:Cbb3-type cytochrome oxidase assembly protein CcoS n=1 Tax=Geomonas diazotrophica TaxID=2843197 RepID=A0ABX8JGJ4_9BACT|nr:MULTISPECIES: cbb3-type cytochrome oxidase assembly protein CcoS [Geomonas]MBU5635460.1 cbb3-type cytochrome oxidase assembly protein CcoS [Geomonas diazotrophica]QWV97490.1 cbb3-type cytochrome oxidase assembly protein CcoS [Geomonas nitrogeniifigens]QXE86629.1 cbb3-type cytochrome oxidase assembly protein CcoS [Geomonas nitrogeniifigens]
MDSPLETPAFLLIWMCLPLLMCGTLIVFFVWGVRSGQFADQERARYLALDSGIPEEPPEEPGQGRGANDYSPLQWPDGLPGFCQDQGGLSGRKGTSRGERS